jgi:7-carboxy-7-deazaguanine synthase
VLNPAAMRARGGTVSEIFVSFQGEGLHAGRRQLFVRLAGCPLRCCWCDTPESLVPVAACRVLGPDGAETRPNPLSAAALAGTVARVRAPAGPLHALAVTGGEPLAQTDFLVEWLGTHPPGLPVLLETAGVLPHRLARVLPLVAIVSLDVKLPSNSGERPLWDEHAVCLAAASAAGCEVYAKMPVDERTDAEDVARGARLVAAAAPGATLYLTPITGVSDGRLAVEPATLARLHAVAAGEHPDVRVLPQLHKVLGIP